MSGDYIEEILTKIQTYKISNWHYLANNTITPYQLASIGYNATTLMNVQCSICHHQVSLQQKQTSQEILTNLQNHEQQCIYKGENIKEIDKKDFYLKMDEIFVNIPLISKALPGNQNICLPVLDMKAFYQQIGPHKHTLIKIFKKFSIDEAKISIPFLLQFMGWKLSEQDHSTLECHFCARSISMKNYVKAESEEQPEQLPEGKKFNLFKQHRFYCLWVEGIEGWKIYMQHIWDKLNEKQSLFKNMRAQQVVKIRVQMDKYLESFQTKTHEIFEKIEKIMQQCNDMAKITDQPQEIEQKTGKVKRNMAQFNQLITEHLKKPLKKIKIS